MLFHDCCKKSSLYSYFWLLSEKRVRCEIGSLQPETQQDRWTSAIVRGVEDEAGIMTTTGGGMLGAMTSADEARIVRLVGGGVTV